MDAPPYVTDATADQALASGDETLEQVVVTGVGSLLETKLADDLQNAPQSISVISRELIEQQAATRLEDALRNVPGITLNAGEGAARGDTVNLRGFSAFNDFFLDGIRDAAVYTRDSFNLESLEVVEGPSATLFGRGSTGGAINQVSKSPTLMPIEAVTAIVGSNDLYRATADVDLPLAGATALRVNAMGERSRVADRDVTRNSRLGLAPTLSFGIGERDTLTLGYLHQQENDIPDPGVPFLDDRPAPARRGDYFGLASDRVRTFDDIGTARFRHQVGDDIEIVSTLRYASYEFAYLDTMPNFGDAVPPSGTPLAAILVGRDVPASSGLQTNLTNETDLVAHLRTGTLSHTLVAGIEVARLTSSIDRYVNPFNASVDWIPETPLLAPDPFESAGAQPVAAEQHTNAHSAAAYVTDTIGIGPLVDLIGGLRFDRFAADYRQVTYASAAVLDLGRVDEVLSPRVALVLKPQPMQTWYLSYGTSFDPSAETLSLTTRTADLGPVKARSYEFGTKWSLLEGALSATGALFRTEVDNAQTNDPENPTITTLNGNQRVTGLEFGLSGHLARQLELTAGYTYLDARTLASGTAAYVGKFLPNTARQAVNIWGEYEVTDKLEFGLGGNWLDRRYGDYGETAIIPGYVVLNAMAAWHVNPALSLQINAFNLAGRLYYQGAYYTSAAENHVLPGAGRSVLLTVRVAL
jgi:catecholate siderophore receptor